MEIFDQYKNTNLTEDQDLALQRIEDFLHNDSDVFILKGYAGTGKTFLLKGIGQYLSKEQRLGQVMAPTGRAAKILKDKTGLHATTIHKAIYNFQSIEPYKQDGADEEKSFKYYFSLNQNEQGTNKVFIIDESSMIGDVYSEGEFFRFGSGKLLTDIISYINTLSPVNQKIILVGDPAQLEPVGDNQSRALDLSYFLNKGLNVEEIEMKDVVRQDKESGILINATEYRKRIEANQCNENLLDTSFNDVEKINHYNVGSLFSDLSPTPEIGNTAIICYSNNLAYDYNRIIRKLYFPNQDTIAPGDLLLITQNNYRQKVELLNGEIIKVVDVSPTTESQTAPVVIDGKRKNIKLNFRNVEIMLPGHESPIGVKIIEDYLNSRHRDLSNYEIKSLYVNFVMRFRKETNNLFKEGSKEFSVALRNDPYFNALRVKYGYAMTCHKAQGGEWENVFVDFRGRIGLSKSHLRWDYTAITRASKKLYTIYPPALKPVSFLNFAPIGKISKIPHDIFYFGDVDTTPFHDKKSHPAVRLKYFEIEDKLRETPFRINRLESRPYLEIYHLNTENDCIRIDLNYNEAGIFTRIHSSDVSEKTEELIKLFKADYSWPIEFEYQSENEVLSYLFQTVSSVCEMSETQIMNVDDSTQSNYYSTYYFNTKADCALIQFYFNKRGQITSALPKSTLGEEDKILDGLIINLKAISYVV